MMLRLKTRLKRNTIEVSTVAKRVMAKVILILTILLILGNITVAPLRAQTPPDEVEFPFWKVDVTYTNPVILEGPLSFGLSELPSEVNAHFQFDSSQLPALGEVSQVSHVWPTASLVFGDADLTLTDLFFTGDDVSVLPKFRIGLDTSGEINFLEYAFGPVINTVTETGGIVLNSSFELNITGTDLATGQDFHYNYQTSTQTITQAAAFDLFVGDIDGGKIWKVDTTTGNATVFRSIDQPEDLELTADGHVIAAVCSSACATSAKLVLIMPDGSSQSDITFAGEIQGVEGPALDANGNLYAQSRGNRGIFFLPRIQLSPPIFGSPVQVVNGLDGGDPEHDANAGEGTAVLFLGPFAGDVLATAPNLAFVNRFTPGTPYVAQGAFAVPSDFPLGSPPFIDGPFDVKQACKGDVYITDGQGRLLRYGSDGSGPAVLVDNPPGFSAPPVFIAILPDGIVYFTLLGTGAKLGRYDTNTDTLLTPLQIKNSDGTANLTFAPLGLAGPAGPACTSDTTPPEITCPDNISVNTDSGSCSAVVDYDPPIGTDNLPAAVTTQTGGLGSGSTFPVGTTIEMYTVTDAAGNTASCSFTVTVVDNELPVISCNAPDTIIPSDAPISFTATATDNCGVTSVEIIDFDCFEFTKKGKRIDKTESCQVQVDGDTITILDSGGVDDHIEWIVRATDVNGNVEEVTCGVDVANPSKTEKSKTEKSKTKK